MRSVKKGFAIVLSLLMLLAVFPFVGVTNTAKAATVSNWVTCTNCSSYRATVNLIINGVSEGTNNYVDGTYEANISQYQVSSPVYLKSSLRPNSATIYVDRSIYSSLDQLNINVQLGSFNIHTNTGTVRWGIQIFGGHSGSPRTYLGDGAERASSNGYNYYIYQSNPSHTGILSAETGTGSLTSNASTSSRTDLTFGPYNWYLRGDAPAVGAAAYIDVAGICVVMAGGDNYQMLSEWTHLSIVGTCSHSAGSHVGANYNGTHSYYCNTCGANVGTYSCSGGAATCTAQAVCTTCGAAYGSVLGHASNGTWMNDNGDVHYTYCTRCGTWLTSGAHSSNGAWMSDWADGHYIYCTACGRWLTSDVHHSNNAWVAADGNTHYTYCVDCGRWLTSGSHTFAWKNNGDGTHSYYCTGCGYVASTAAHSGGSATCTASPVCTTCGASYGTSNGHISNGAWMSDNADVHYTYCTVCHEWLTSGSHRSNGSWVAVDGSTHRMYCPDCGRTMNTGNHTMAYKNNSDGTHSYYCRDCGYVASTTAHAGGTATCTSAPVCAYCGVSYDTQLGHSFTNYIPDGNATCLADGTKTAKCERCDMTDTMADANSKLAHSYSGTPISNDDGTHSFKCVNGCNEYGGSVNCTFGEWTTTTVPGCTTTGVKEHTCTVCGYKAEADIEADGHSYGDLIAEVPATCMANGVKAHYECSVCQKYFDADKNELASLVIPVDPTAHTGNNHAENYKDSTCTEKGYTGDTVCECGVAVVTGSETDMLDHEYTVYVDVDTAATCMANRKDTYKCANCDATTVKEIADSKDAANHTGNNTTGVNAKDATCTEKGYTGDTVCECGVTVVTGTEIAILDHVYGDWVVTLAATCMAKGTERRTCAKCPAYEERDIEVEPDNHTNITHLSNEKSATCTGKGYTGDTVCECGTTIATGTEIDMLDHAYGDWEVTLAATCMAKGTERRTCANCPAYEERDIDIDPTAHTGETYEGKDNIVDATCTEKGSYDEVIFCADCDSELSREMKEIPVDPTNHIGAYNTVKVDATCTEAGHTGGKYCPDCDQWIIAEEVIPALEHKNAYAGEAKDAICTEKGNSAGLYCPDCEQWIVAQEEIPAINHASAYTVEATSATCAKDGKTEGKYCPDCETWLIAQETIPATGIHTGMDDFICDVCEYYDEFGALAAAKTAGKAEVNALADETSSDAVKTIVTTAVEDINAAESIEDVNAIVEVAKKDVADQLAADALAEAKAAGKAEVNALVDETSSDAVKAIVAAVGEDIDAAESIEDINAIVEAAKKAVAEQKAAEEAAAALAEAKEDAIAALDAAVADIAANSEVEGAAEKAAAVVEEAKAAINAASTVEEVNAAKKAADSVIYEAGVCEHCRTRHQIFLFRIVCKLIQMIHAMLDIFKTIGF